MSEHLTEHVADWRSAVVVERETRTIRNVALAGAESKNGYRYAESALKGAARLYEGVPVFLDHPASPHRPRDRSARDLAGSVANVRYEGGRLRGDLRTLDTDAGRTLLALADADGPGVGMSHVVLAQRSGDGGLVERIVEVVSVDAVAFPATTRTFTERREGVVSRSPDRDTRTDRRSPDGSGRPAVGRVAGSGDPATTSNRTRVRRVRNLMNLPERRGGAPASAGRLGAAGRAVPSSAPGLSAPVPDSSRPGSLERLLASVDAELPGHLRRLAAASALAPGRRGVRAGVRVGLYPGHVVVERRGAGGRTETFALAWRLDGDRVRFGEELVPYERVAGRVRSWGDVLASQHKETTDDTNHRIEQLTERLREATAERDRLAERLSARGPTSVLRRGATCVVVADEVFVRTVRRR